MRSAIATLPSLLSTTRSRALGRTLKRRMKKAALAVRIIRRVKCSVQGLNRGWASYGTVGALAVGAGLASYATVGPSARPASYVVPSMLAAGTVVQTEMDEFAAADDDAAEATDEPTEPSGDDATGATDEPTEPSDDEADGDEAKTATENDDDDEEAAGRGVIYARVSSNEQVESGYGLETQVSDLREIAEERNVELVREPIKDAGESGTDFERDGIKEVFQLATEGEITHLLVDDADRLGRSAPQTVYFVYVLQTKCDVTILTSAGELDTTQIHGLVEMTMKALSSHMAAQERARKANRSRVRRFTDDKQWLSWFKQVPVGYLERDDGWIEPHADEVPLAEAMFTRFVECESYAATRRYLRDAYADTLSKPLTRGQVKRHLQKRVYIGEPTIPVDGIEDDETKKSVEDPDLALVDEDTFETAQELIEEKSRANSTDEDTIDVDFLTEEFGLFPVLDSSPVVAVLCPDCRSEMVKNGQRNLSGDFKSHNYICTSDDCDTQRRFPYRSEYECIHKRSQK